MTGLIPKLNKNRWDILGYIGISHQNWDIPGLAGIFWDIPGFVGIYYVSFYRHVQV